VRIQPSGSGRSRGELESRLLRRGVAAVVLVEWLVWEELVAVAVACSYDGGGSCGTDMFGYWPMQRWDAIVRYRTDLQQEIPCGSRIWVKEEDEREA